MKFTSQQYAAALCEAISGKTKQEAAEIMDGFFKVLNSNNDLYKAAEIVKKLDAIWDNREGVMRAEIISARAMDKAVVNTIAAYIKKMSTAKEIRLSEKIDRDILGGVIIKYGDKVIDASAKAAVRSIGEKIIK